MLGEFTDWTARYLAAPVSDRSSLEKEGVQLANVRRPIFQALIQNEPRRAIEEAVPRVVRQELPASIVELLEKPVSAVGNYNVYWGRPMPGTERPAEGLVLRYFEAQDTSYKAHVYGQMQSVMSKKGVPLRGVSIDRDMAVAESAVRRLEVGERIPAGVSVEETCPVSGLVTESVAVSGATVTEATPTVEIGTRIITLCNGSHVTLLEEDFRTYVQASGPGGGGFFMDNFPGTSSRAIGNFRCLYIRVTYPDQMAQPNTEEQAYADMRDSARFYLEGSYGKMTQTTTVTAVVTLPHTVAWYKAKDAEVDGLGLVHSDSRNAARALGYDSTQYDCTIVRVNKGPRLEGISWGGGDSVWITWDGMDVLNHECGHSLGRNHANSWDSLDGTPYGYGQNGEYGNPFDVMGGGGGFGSHYNTISKRALGWLPDSAVHAVKGGGVYRIFAYDQPTLEEGKRYALHVAKDSVRRYCLEYHPASGAQRDESALVLYSGMGSNAGHLLDTTQGTTDGKSDGGIALGRTFSDWEADMHFTVLGKNATTPPSLDVAYFRGPFPGNTPPTVTLSTSATTIAVGAAVTFTATAADAEGDALAYRWESSDGVNGGNSAIYTRTFPVAAQVTTMLTVSDMKGGKVRRSVVINVGSHGKQTISGTVTAGGQPLGDVYITGGGKWCYSNSDGTYALSGISTGAQTLDAVLSGYGFTPTFTNPLTVVSGTNTANWSAAPSTFVTLTKVADATEGGSNGIFRFTRTGGTDAALVVQVSPAGGTAVKGTDYTFTPDHGTSGSFRSFTIPANASTLDVTVAAVNTSGAQDTTAEGPETITLQMAGAAGYISNSGNAVQMTVFDNDTTLPLIGVEASDPYAQEGGSPESGIFTISRTGSTASALTVNLTWSGAAANGTDYGTLPSTATIAAGQTAATLTVAPLNDAAMEGPEDVTVTLGTSADYLRDSAATTATITISDDDLPVVTVTAPDASASEAGANGAVFLIARTGDLSAPLKVYFGLSGSALHGTDYAPLTGELTIPAGAAVAPVVISPYNDDIAEPTETVTLAVANFNNGYSIGGPFQASATIEDNSDTPLVNVRSGAVGVEGGANPTFIFQSIGSGSGNITVQYTLSGTATSGADFTAVSGSISVSANGSNETTLTIPLINDTDAESTETIVATIVPSASYRAYNDASAEAIIQDNDSGGDRVMVSTYNHSPNEAGAVAGTFYFSRTGTAGDLTVQYSISGTATNGVDYATLSGSVVIPDTQSGVNVSMIPIDDTALEGFETVTLTVLPGTGYGPDRPASATFAIADNESPTIRVGFEQSTLVTTEIPGALGEYRDVVVTLSAASPNTVTVRYGGGGGNATGDDVDWAFVDASANNAVIPGGLLTFPPGVVSRTLRIRIKNDGVSEGSEIAILQLSQPWNATFVSGRSQQTVTIFDAVIPPLMTEERWNTGNVYNNNTWNSVTPDYSGFLPGFTALQDVADGFSRRITGQIIAPSTGAYTFWIASDDSSRLYLSTTASAAQKTQIATLSGWTGFQNWDANTSQKSASIQLVAGQSYYMEVQHQEGGGGDHVSVAWQGPGFARTPITSASPDTAPMTVRFLTTATTRVESDGSEPLLQVLLDRPVAAGTVSVDFATLGSATNGADYVCVAGTLTFAIGEQMKKIPLTLLTDAVGETPETIVVALSNPVGATLAAPATHTITLLNTDIPEVNSLFVTASASQGAGALIATATTVPAAGVSITGWSILSGNTSGVFAIDATGRITLAVPSALPNPGAMQLIIRAINSAGVSGDGVVNIVCNPGSQAVVEQRWSGSTAFWGEAWTGTTSFSGKLNTLTTTQNVADNYSRRLLTYLKPTTTGDYTFWIAGDDDCRLYLSTDGYQANKVRIAEVNGYTNFQVWDQRGAQKSAAIPLVAGKVYWIEAQQVEGGGGDHVSVAWSGPGFSRVAIPASALMATAPGINFIAPQSTVPNTAPTISNISDLAIVTNASTGLMAFTVADTETPAASLPVSASSSNILLVPHSSITLGGTGTQRTISAAPALNQSGSATITVTVNDGLLTTNESFVVTVVANNAVPTISAIANQNLAVNENSAALAFAIGDAETPAGSLILTKTSSDPAVVPTAGMVIGGSGSNRTLTITPAADRIGTTTLTLTVSDGVLSATTSLVVTVNGTPSQSWRQQYFGSTSSAGLSADTADPDFDGTPNLLEYALGLDPRAVNAPMSGIVTDSVVVGNASYMRLRITKNPMASDVAFSVEGSGMDGPTTWSPVGTTIEVNTSTSLIVRDNTPIGTTPMHFMRLRVIR